MSPAPYLPSDQFSDATPADVDLAADFLELEALLSESGESLRKDIVDALELAADEDSPDDETRNREEIAWGAVNRMSSRKRVLAGSYPFEIDNDGDVIRFTGEEDNLGHTAYLVSLVLSNLRTLSPLLDEPGLHPTQEEVYRLRQCFQYLATAAVAGEVGGPAWSFGFPRPDGSGFLGKLSEIWGSLRDGRVEADPSAPSSPKDDQIDIFAWREQRDGLPGFLLIAAQVATGQDWKSKPIKNHVRDVFPSRWFNPEPATSMVTYHVIPFARPDEFFRDDVLVLGNVLHRVRVRLGFRKQRGWYPRVWRWRHITNSERLLNASALTLKGREFPEVHHRLLQARWASTFGGVRNIWVKLAG